jgi:putative membrane protein
MGDEAALYNDFLPALNAVLNGTAAVLLLLGYIFIKKQKKVAHRNVMLMAFAVSTAFLVSYLYYHFNFTAKKFAGSGVLRNLYLTMLVSHILGAIILVPGVLTTLWHAYTKNWTSHTRWSRKVWPLWMYISVTGVLIYFSLYGAHT